MYRHWFILLNSSVQRQCEDPTVAVGNMVSTGYTVITDLYSSDYFSKSLLRFKLVPLVSGSSFKKEIQMEQGVVCMLTLESCFYVDNKVVFLMWTIWFILPQHLNI